MRKLDLDNEYQAKGYSYLLELMDILKQRRIHLGLTQKQLAEISGVSVSTISKYERGIFPTRVVWLAAYMKAVEFPITAFGY